MLECEQTFPLFERIRLPAADTEHTYLCIDLKSFYASVECAARGLDPFTTNLVVADPTRTEKTICLAITPAMKDLGVRNRCRVFEIPPDVDYIMAKPHMRRYMEVSAEIYSVYLRYISPEDIHVYSIDECFIDATPYLSLYGKTPRELAVMLMDAVLTETGICATAGIGTNLFLAKVALDITAKHADDHIGFLDAAEFDRLISHHRPITDIWNIGPGIAARLARYRVFDLAGVAALDEDLLYKEFGVNAEFLIDHAHGVEPCTIRQIHEYEPQGSSMTNGQVLACDYTFDEALVVMREMVDQSCLEMVEKHLVCERIFLHVGYAKGSPGSEADDAGMPIPGVGAVSGPSTEAAGGDAGSAVPAAPLFDGGHGLRSLQRNPGGYVSVSRKLSERTNSFRKLLPRFEELYRERVDVSRAVKRVSIGFSGLMPVEFASVDLFTDVAADQRELDMQQTILAVKKRFGKNAMVKGMSLREKATGMERNEQVGGHHA